MASPCVTEIKAKFMLLGNSLFPFPIFLFFVLLGFKFWPKNSGASTPTAVGYHGHPGGASSPSTTVMAALRRRSIARPSCIRCAGLVVIILPPEDGGLVVLDFLCFFTPFGKMHEFILYISYILVRRYIFFGSLKVGAL